MSSNVTPPLAAAEADYLILLFAKDMLPQSLVESSVFQTFVKSLDSLYQLPSRKHLSTKLMTEQWKATDNTLKQLLVKILCFFNLGSLD